MHPPRRPGTEAGSHTGWPGRSRKCATARFRADLSLFRTWPPATALRGPGRLGGERLKGLVAVNEAFSGFAEPAYGSGLDLGAGVLLRGPGGAVSGDGLSADRGQPAAPLRTGPPARQREARKTQGRSRCPFREGGSGGAPTHHRSKAHTDETASGEVHEDHHQRNHRMPRRGSATFCAPGRHRPTGRRASARNGKRTSSPAASPGVAGERRRMGQSGGRRAVRGQSSLCFFLMWSAVYRARSVTSSGVFTWAPTVMIVAPTRMSTWEV